MSGRPEPLGRQLAEGDGHRGGDVEHVDGPAPPHLAVDQLAAERVVRPPGGVDRHDVGVTHQAQRRRRRVVAFDAGDDGGATRPALEPLDVEPGTLEVRLQQVGVADLVAGVGRAVVDALVADQRLQQLGGRTGERLGIRHAPNLRGSSYTSGASTRKG